MITLYLAGGKRETAYRATVHDMHDRDPYFTILDPFNNPTRPIEYKKIVEDDKGMILASDVVVAYVQMFTAGTMMEIEFAYSNNIPVYVITDNSAISDDIWVKYHTTLFFSSIGNCFAYMRNERIFTATTNSEPEEYGCDCKERRIVVEGIQDVEYDEPVNLMADGRFGLDDSKVATKLLDKNFSPMIIRKYTRLGFPLYVHLICDYSLSDLDNVVHDCIDLCTSNGILENDIQSLRNFTGILSDTINKHYDKKKRGCVESIGIIYYVDKMIISSLQGDCMNHNSCRQELYDSLNLMTKI